MYVYPGGFIEHAPEQPRICRRLLHIGRVAGSLHAAAITTEQRFHLRRDARQCVCTTQISQSGQLGKGTVGCDLHCSSSLLAIDIMQQRATLRALLRQSKTGTLKSNCSSMPSAAMMPVTLRGGEGAGWGVRVEGETSFWWCWGAKEKG